MIRRCIFNWYFMKVSFYIDVGVFSSVCSLTRPLAYFPAGMLIKPLSTQAKTNTTKSYNVMKILAKVNMKRSQVYIYQISRHGALRVSYLWELQSASDSCSFSVTCDRSGLSINPICEKRTRPEQNWLMKNVVFNTTNDEKTKTVKFGFRTKIKILISLHPSE